MTGDFNIDMMKVNDENTNYFLYINSSFGLQPVIERPTRITINTASLIDSIFINTLETDVEGGIFSVDLITDHLPVFLILKKTNLLSKKKQTFNYFKSIIPMLKVEFFQIKPTIYLYFLY